MCVYFSELVFLNATNGYLHLSSMLIERNFFFFFDGGGGGRGRQREGGGHKSLGVHIARAVSKKHWVYY